MIQLIKNHLQALVLLAFLFSGIHAFAQTDSSKSSTEKVYDTAEVMPKFPGGEDALLKFIMNNLRYPAMAIEEDIQGKVVISFIVGSDGVIREIEVIQGLDTDVKKKPLR